MIEHGERPASAEQGSQRPLALVVEGEGPQPTVLFGNLEMGGTTALPHGLRVRGDLELEEGGRLEGPVEVTGTLIVGRDALVLGTVAVGGDLWMRTGSVIGPASVGGDACLEEHAIVQGELTCEGLYLAPAAPPGEPEADAPT